MPTKKKRVPVTLNDEQHALISAIAESLDQSLSKTMLDILTPVLEQANFLNEQIKEVKSTRKALDNLEAKMESDIDALKGETLALLKQARLKLDE